MSLDVPGVEPPANYAPTRLSCSGSSFWHSGFRPSVSHKWDGNDRPQMSPGPGNCCGLMSRYRNRPEQAPPSTGFEWKGEKMIDRTSN